jgi:hypothetical protein
MAGDQNSSSAGRTYFYSLDTGKGINITET